MREFLMINDGYTEETDTFQCFKQITGFWNSPTRVAENQVQLMSIAVHVHGFWIFHKKASCLETLITDTSS